MVIPQPTSYTNLTKENIAEALENGLVRTNGYIYMLLYDHDDEQQFTLISDFLRKYGATVNNKLGVDVPMFTVFSADDRTHWEDRLYKPVYTALTPCFSCDGDFTSPYRLLKRLAANYNVINELPALVIIDGQNRHNVGEQYTSISFRDLQTSEAIFRTITNVMEIVNNNPNNFEAICSECKTAAQRQTERLEDFIEKRQKILKEFVDLKMKERGITNYSDLDAAIGCASHNTRVSYFKGKRAMDENTAFRLAFYFQLSGPIMDDLLEFTTLPKEKKRRYLERLDNRYNLIRDFLSAKRTVYEADAYLKNNNMDPIITPPRKRRNPNSNVRND